MTEVKERNKKILGHQTLGLADMTVKNRKKNRTDHRRQNFIDGNKMVLVA